ncbi:MAG: hypothetical protein Q9204_009410, partial [Flavoplaca sp. TL-2023a]
NIQDSAFGLLGSSAAVPGQGSTTDTDCLHQATADQAFTNAKDAGDSDGMANALIYAAFKRNTGKVELTSVLCTAINATNPEIAAIPQHQDLAAPGATATNKGLTLEIARQIASIGANPKKPSSQELSFLESSMKPTTTGQSCNMFDDEPGCIFTQNLSVKDTTTC